MLVNPQLIPTGISWPIASRALATTLNIPRVIQTVETQGYYSEGDLGAATYKRVAVEPAHTGKFQSNDGAWFELINKVVSPSQFGAIGDNVANDTAAVAAAFAFSLSVFIPKDATYYTDTVFMRAGQSVSGFGTLRLRNVGGSGASNGVLSANSGSAVSTIDNITVRDVTLLGNVLTGGFLEFVHLFTIHGVRNCLVENVRFIGFQGDGFVAGSGDVGGEERHNYNVTIRSCYFDGLNKDNRNGISGIDCDGLIIDGCTFKNCSRSNMPGSIDFEPDNYAYHVIKNITIINNHFDNTGGNVAVISLFIPPLVPIPVGVHIENNYSVDYTGSGAFVYVDTNRDAVTGTVSDIRIINNYAKTGVIGVGVVGVNGVLVQNNTMVDFTNPSIIGEVAQKCIDVVWDCNTHVRCGSVVGNGVIIGPVDGLEFTNNTLTDCGSGVGGAANAIDFVTGVSTNVCIQGNRISSPTGKTLVAIQKEAAHTLTPITNKYIENQVGTLPVNFTAEYSDVLETSYTPIIEGTTTPGVGTYSVQFGAYRRLGNIVFVRGSIAVTSHTGSGQIEISLPIDCATVPNNRNFAVAASVTGASLVSAGGQTGALNPAAVCDGVTGAIRMVQLTTGAGAQLVIPAGSLEVQFSCWYVCNR